MKKQTLRIQEQQPKTVQRADIAPENGYVMVVDGVFKAQFFEASVATRAATELLARFSVLQIAIYDAVAKTRTALTTGKAPVSS
jgi:hypothetical protein